MITRSELLLKYFEHLQANFSSSSAAVIDEEEEEEERAFQQEIQQWRKTSGGGSTKPKYVYKTLDELKDKGAAMGRRKKGKGGFGSETKVKVIDLTGREARVMDSYEEMRQTKAGDTSTAGKIMQSPLHLRQWLVCCLCRFSNIYSTTTSELDTISRSC